jgi:hypothetical protein
MMQRNTLGLCFTCNNIPTCVQTKERKKPVLYCELFDDYESPPAIIEINTDRSKMTDLSELRDRDLLNSEGLCWDCEKKESCFYKQKNIGCIWHCEEYE